MEQGLVLAIVLVIIWVAIFGSSLWYLSSRVKDLLEGMTPRQRAEFFKTRRQRNLDR